MRFSRNALATAPDAFGHHEKAIHPDGTMTVNVPLWDPEEKSWIYRTLSAFGTEAELLGPRRFRRELRQRLERLLNIYRSPSPDTGFRENFSEH